MEGPERKLRPGPFVIHAAPTAAQVALEGGVELPQVVPEAEPVARFGRAKGRGELGGLVGHGPEVVYELVPFAVRVRGVGVGT